MNRWCTGMMRQLVIIMCGGMVIAAVAAAQPPSNATGISARLKTVLETAPDTAAVKVWVYFADKENSALGYQKALATMSDRARLRRRALPPDWFDLPVKAEYIEMVRAAGGLDIRPSRWLNAVSARLTPAAINSLAAMPGIRRLEPVITFTRPLPDTSASPDKALPSDSAMYGFSYTQIHQLRVDSLHRVVLSDGGTPQPLNGAGVLVALFDTGFEPDLPVFDSLHLLDTWDFINNDATVDDDQPVAAQKTHGTEVLSVCGGFDDFDLVGPAYGADFILAKTELVATEIQIEEDYWVAAAEWADSLGADIISTSLGYYDWYTYGDLDGNTAVTTIAADLAASRGILMVNSAGNQGNTPWYFIMTPADGDSVVAVGAVDASGQITSFSSHGPTADGRIKPDVVAMGSNVWCALPAGGFARNSGTSFSAPLIAGSAALILQANPTFRGNPMAIRQRLEEAGDRYLTPDNTYGYGLPDMVLAAGFGLKISPPDPITIIAYRDTVIDLHIIAPPGGTLTYDVLSLPSVAEFVISSDSTATLSFTAPPTGHYLYQVVVRSGEYADTLDLTVDAIWAGEAVTYGPNPFEDSFNIYFNIPGGEHRIEVFTLAGEMVFSRSGSESVIVWPGINSRQEKVAAGVYIIHISADGRKEKVKVLKL